MSSFDAKYRIWTLSLVFLLFQLLLPFTADAMPVFARKYSMSCVACHSAFPRLNQFGEHFAANNMRLPNWRDDTVQTGDDRLALPASSPRRARTVRRSLKMPGSGTMMCLAVTLACSSGSSRYPT